MKSLADRIDDAISILQTEGWAKGKYHIPGKGYCVSGAMNKAGISLIERQVIYSYLWSEIGGRSLPIWNDFVAESVEDVVLMLKKAKTESNLIGLE